MSTLEEFDKTAETVDAKDLRSMASNPSIRLQNEENEGKGKFVFGKYLLVRSFKKKTGQGMNHYADIRLIETNADATSKVGDKYVVVPTTPGQIVTLMIPSVPKRFLEATAPGALVKLTYLKLGFIKGKTGARVPTHEFEMKRGKVELTPEDTAYILSKQKVAVKESEGSTEAEDNLGQIEGD